MEKVCDYKDDGENLELSDSQVERNDDIYNAVYSLCCVMTENNDLEWDMSFIGDIADAAAGILFEHGYKIRFPSIVTEPDGRQYVDEFF